MHKAKSDPGLVALSTAAYRLLLKFYPNRFQREYGPHMVQVFRDCCLKSYRHSGPPGMLSLWALTLFDWFKTVIEEQLNRGTDMTRTKFIRLSGWGTVIGAIAMILSFLSDPNAIRIALYRLFDPPLTSEVFSSYRTFSENVGAGLLLAAILLLIIGIIGLHLRYGRQPETLANNSLLLSIVSGGAAMLGIVGDSFVQWDGWWPILWISVATLFAGLALFGIGVLRTKPMPRWNGLPVIAGIGLPIFTVVAFTFEFEPPDWLSRTIMLTTAISLVTLGFMLQADVADKEAA